MAAIAPPADSSATYTRSASIGGVVAVAACRSPLRVSKVASLIIEEKSGRMSTFGIGPRRITGASDKRRAVPPKRKAFGLRNRVSNVTRKSRAEGAQRGASHAIGEAPRFDDKAEPWTYRLATIRVNLAQHAAHKPVRSPGCRFTSIAICVAMILAAASAGTDRKMPTTPPSSSPASNPNNTSNAGISIPPLMR